VLEVEGVVEEVNLRTTHIRAVSDELYVVPNGDIRVIRDLSRAETYPDPDQDTSVWIRSDEGAARPSSARG
jgi:hypothetical protein